MESYIKCFSESCRIGEDGTVGVLSTQHATQRLQCIQNPSFRNLKKGPQRRATYRSEDNMKPGSRKFGEFLHSRTTIISPLPPPLSKKKKLCSITFGSLFSLSMPSVNYLKKSYVTEILCSLQRQALHSVLFESTSLPAYFTEYRSKAT